MKVRSFYREKELIAMISTSFLKGAIIIIRSSDRSDLVAADPFSNGSARRRSIFETIFDLSPSPLIALRLGDPFVACAFVNVSPTSVPE